MLDAIPDPASLAFVLIGALLAGFTTGFAGFGTGLVAAGLWFHALPAEMVPPGVFSVLLKFFELPAVFAVSGLTMLALAHYSRRVHPRLGRSRRETTPPEIAPITEPSEAA